jgi:hypothetical protein
MNEEAECLTKKWIEFPVRIGKENESTNIKAEIEVTEAQEKHEKTNQLTLKINEKMEERNQKFKKIKYYS